MKKYFIITLTPVDFVTISGIVLSLCSAGLVLAGMYSLALSVLFIAMLFDAFDGVLARKFGLVRDFGRYLDGFVDVFDYLAVPSLFLYRWGFDTWYYAPFLALFIIAGVIRLSVFNEIGNIKDDNEELAYLGMPVFWSVLILGLIYIIAWFFPRDVLFPCVAAYLGLFSFFMVYRRRFFKVKSVILMLVIILGSAALFALDGFGVIDPRNTDSGPVFMAAAGRHITSGFLMALPAIIGGSLHMLAVSKDWLAFMKIPISERLFGANKTVRGFFLMCLFSVVGALALRGILLLFPMDLSIDILGIPFWQLGLATGFGYVLFELPNSFVKRRMGIGPGELPDRHRFLFLMLDQIDSGMGVALAAWLFFPTPYQTALGILFLSFFVPPLVKKVLYVLKWKKVSR